MTVYEAGRESSILDDMLIGHKTIEGRLNRGKFARYLPGDFVWLRRDIYRDGQVFELTHQGLVRVVRVTAYPDFRTMLETEGVTAVLPRASDIEDALRQYAAFYSPAEERSHGVLAIEVALAHPSELGAAV